MNPQFIGAIIQKVADFQTVTGFEANVLILNPELACYMQLLSKHLSIRIIIDDSTKTQFQVGFLA